MSTFRKTFHARWGDMDFNGHMRNTAYLDMAGDVRMLFFDSKGFSMREFEKLRVGPVIVHDELDYYREVRMLESYDATLTMQGLSEDASRFKMRNDYFRADGKPVARVTSVGGWLDLETRKLRLPPDALADVLRAITKADDFEVLPTFIK